MDFFRDTVYKKGRVKIRGVTAEICTRADKETKTQTDKHAYHSTLLSYGGGVTRELLDLP